MLAFVAKTPGARRSGRARGVGARVPVAARLRRRRHRARRRRRARARTSRTSAASTGSTGRCSCSISTGSCKMLRGDFGESLYFKTDVARPRRSTSCRPRPCSRCSRSLFALADLGAARRARGASIPTAGSTGCASLLAVVGQALPNFFFALILIMVLAVTWQLLPVSGSETLGAFRAADDRARLLRGACLHAARARRHDRGARLRLHPHRARQGPVGRRASWSSTRCATRSCRWWRLRRCSSASCSAARW